MLSQFLKLFFKQKNVELTAEDLQLLEGLEQQTGVKVSEIPGDISHNVKIINDLKQSFEGQLSALNTQLSELKQERDAYKAEIDNLTKIIGEERTAREASLKAIQEKQEKELTERVDALIKGAIETKRLPAQNADAIEKLKNYAKTNYEDAKAIIDAMTPIVDGTQQNNKPNGQQGVQTKAETLHQGIASGANPIVAKFVEEQFAKIDSN